VEEYNSPLFNFKERAIIGDTILSLKQQLLLFRRNQNAKKTKTWNKNVTHHYGEPGFNSIDLIFLCDLCVLCGQMLFQDYRASLSLPT
jgi:hypothetical protein